ncbi:MAG: hypothetical protein ABDI19_01330 [Armatimonadota bacterium]
MRSAIAASWLLVALLGFVSGNLLSLSPSDGLARVGMMLYAVILVVSLIAAALNRLREEQR